jgi:hypothetical protein
VELLPLVLLVKRVDDGRDGFSPHIGAIEHFASAHVVFRPSDGFVDIAILFFDRIEPNVMEVWTDSPNFSAAMSPRMRTSNASASDAVRPGSSRANSSLLRVQHNPLPQMGDDRLGGKAEQAVPLLAAKGIVDQTQAVDVSESNRQRQAPPYAQPSDMLFKMKYGCATW